MDKKIPGLMLAVALAALGSVAADGLGAVAGLQPGALSGIMMAILLGLVLGNVRPLPVAVAVHEGIGFAVKRVLQVGIVLLGLRLSVVQVGAIGLRTLPVVLVTIPAAILVVTMLGRWIKLPPRLATLIAVGTCICGNTAIVAMAPTVGARDEETSYAVACITLFGLLAMVAYPWAAHGLFGGDAFSAGLFLGTAIHDTSQVAGAGVVYQELFGDAQALDVATVAKLERNLSMLVVIPLVSVLHHRRAAQGATAPPWWSLVPLFVLGFAATSAVRTWGDLGPRPFGVLEPAQWRTFVSLGSQAASACLAVAMAGVGLSTRLEGLRAMGLRPLGLELLSALTVGAISLGLISALYGGAL